jgi:hypothetical protein
MSAQYREFVDSREGFQPSDEDWHDFECWLDAQLDAFDREERNSELNAGAVVRNVVVGWAESALELGE